MIPDGWLCIYLQKKVFIIDSDRFSKSFYKEYCNHPPAIFQGGLPDHEWPADADSSDVARPETCS
jgi:hypothetical protein